jgi:hypothetical protein
MLGIREGDEGIRLFSFMHYADHQNQTDWNSTSGGSMISSTHLASDHHGPAFGDEIARIHKRFSAHMTA